MDQKDLPKWSFSKQSMIHKVVSGYASRVDHLSFNPVAHTFNFIQNSNLIVLHIFFKTRLIEKFSHGLVAAVVNGGDSIFIFDKFALFFQEEVDEFFVSIFCCKMECCISIIIVGICVNIEFEEYFGNFEMPSQDGNMQAISVEFGDCVDISLMFT